MAGDPDLESTAEALQRLDAVGADVIELGVPYSVRDPSPMHEDKNLTMLMIFKPRTVAEWNQGLSCAQLFICSSSSAGFAMQDPLADGPVIQGAATRALEKGTTLDSVISMLSKVSPTIRAPLVMFTYYNPIMRRGMDKFMQQIKAAGASGGSA